MARSHVHQHRGKRQRNMKALSHRGADLRMVVHMRGKGRCYFCGRTLSLRTMTIDHLVPIVRGGSQDIDNMCIACGPCNTAKGKQMIEEYRRACGVGQFPGERAARPVAGGLSALRIKREEA